MVNIGTDLSKQVLLSRWGEAEHHVGDVARRVFRRHHRRRVGQLDASACALLGSNVVFVVGTIIQVATHTVWTMIVGRGFMS